MCSTVRQLVPNRGQERGDRPVDQDHLVLGVIDHVGQLLGEEPDVQRVQDRAHARDGQIGGHVGVVVPHERAHPVAPFDTQPGQRRRQAVGVFSELAEGDLLDVAGPVVGQHLCVAVHPTSVIGTGT